METVLLEFNIRAKDVDDYFIFLDSLEKQTTQLAVLDSAGKYQIQNLDPELAKTLKANGFLLLYNLVESTMRNAIEAIFEEFKNKSISFDQLKPEIKLIVLQNLKNRSPKKIYLTINQLSTDIIEELLEMKEEVVEYLVQILENIRDYLDNEEYLELLTGNP